MKFPNDFLLGATTASYKIEGAWNEDGKGISSLSCKSIQHKLRH